MEEETIPANYMTLKTHRSHYKDMLNMGLAVTSHRQLKPIKLNALSSVTILLTVRNNTEEQRTMEGKGIPNAGLWFGETVC